MNFGESFTFAFQDSDWFKKIAISGLIGLIPIVGQLYLMGWGLEITQRLIKGQSLELPEVDFGRYLGRGFKACVVGLVYSIPVILVAIIYSVVMALVSGGVAALSGSSSDTSSMMGIVVILFQCCFWVVMVVFEVVLGLYLPAAYGYFMDNGEEISAGFKMGNIFALVKASPVSFLLVIAGMIVAGMLANALGVLICGLGVILTSPYSQLVIGHLTGQAYNQAKGKVSL